MVNPVGKAKARTRLEPTRSCETKFVFPVRTLRFAILLSLSQSRPASAAIRDGKLEQIRPPAVIPLKPEMMAYD